MDFGFGGGSDFQIPVLSTLVGMLADAMRFGLQYCYEISSRFGFPNYVIAIIVLTVIIKTLLLPLAIKQIRSMKAMQEIQPEIQKVQKKYRNDPAMLRQEMGRLYKENNASPMAGCLPLLIQMPFLIAMYYAIQGFNYDPAHAGFLWIESLAAEDTTFLLPALAAVTTFLVSWQTTPKDAPGNQKTMLFMMPLMIGWMSLNFPSGLVIYWIVNNVYQFFQQLIMFRGEKGKTLVNGASKKGVVTVHGSKEETEEAPKRKKKVIRKKVIKKVVKKPQTEEISSEVHDNNVSAKSGETPTDKQVTSDSGKAGEEK